MFAGLRLSTLGQFTPEFPDAEALHMGLAKWNRRRLAVQTPSGDWQARLNEDLRMLRLEGGFVEAFRAHVADLVADIPADPDRFIAWFEALKASGPGQWDPLFGWLEADADLEQMKWFLTQEAAGEAGFDDLVAMTQVKLPARAKLELARNYWDEMGRGAMPGMHGPMLDRTVQGLGLRPTIEGTLWQSLALANLMTAFATTRRYAYQSVGALGVVELSAPTRVSCVDAGLKRLGCAPDTSEVFRPARPSGRRALGRVERGSAGPAGQRRPKLRAVHRRGRRHAPDLRRAVLRNLSRAPVGARPSGGLRGGVGVRLR